MCWGNVDNDKTLIAVSYVLIDRDYNFYVFIIYYSLFHMEMV